eukprot:892265-Pelagomonas_calceolata.AAC.1
MKDHITLVPTTSDIKLGRRGVVVCLGVVMGNDDDDDDDDDDDNVVVMGNDDCDENDDDDDDDDDMRRSVGDCCGFGMGATSS